MNHKRFILFFYARRVNYLSNGKVLKACREACKVSNLAFSMSKIYII